MREWLRRIYSRTAKFDMFRSIWFANLDCLVNIVQYLHDDSDEYKQPNIANQSDQSNEPKQCNKSADHNCANCGAGISNGTGHDCYCNYPINRNSNHFGSNSAKHFNDSVNEYNELYSKLSNTKYYDDVGYRESTRNP